MERPDNNIMNSVTKEDLKEILGKNWLTHDAMWFAISVQTIGIKKTNLINRKAVRSMARIEAKRLSKLLNVSKINSINELVAFFVNSLELIGGDFFSCDYKIIDENCMNFYTRKCFAFEGVSKLGVISDYECGIFDRIEGWLDFFNISFSKEPNELKCLMHLNGECVKTYTFNFN